LIIREFPLDVLENLATAMLDPADREPEAIAVEGVSKFNLNRLARIVVARIVVGRSGRG
jgi:hypothetical protein